MRAKTRGSKVARVEEANRARDIAASLPVRSLRCGAVGLRVDCYTGLDMPADTRAWALSLLERNMRDQYNSAGPAGWDPAAKEAEMLSPASRHLVLRTEEALQHVAFSHFRFDMDYEEDVLYCYEIQIEEQWQRKGIGRWAIQFLVPSLLIDS